LGSLGADVIAWRPDPASIDAGAFGWDTNKVIERRPVDSEALANADVVLLDDPSEISIAGATAASSIVVRVSTAGSGRYPELLAQARSGWLGAVGGLSNDPIRIGIPAVTASSGVAAVQAVFAGLISRLRDGLGQSILIDPVRVGLSLAHNLITSESDFDERAGFAGIPWSPPDRGSRCSDGEIAFAFHRDDDSFESFCDWLGVHEVGIDARFSTSGDRLRYRHELDDALAPHLAKKTTDDTVEKLVDLGVLVGRYVPPQDLSTHPQVLALELMATDGRERASLTVPPFTLDEIRPQLHPRTYAGDVA
jgi:crotonobetainyl-CoA:carnitine CoA-transferase CaiB-like acyl-CoA transferase